MKTWNHKGRHAPFSSSVSFPEAAPKIILEKILANFSKIPWKTRMVDLYFSSRTDTFIFAEIKLRSMLYLEFCSSFYLEYLRFIVVPLLFHLLAFSTFIQNYYIMFLRGMFCKISMIQFEFAWRIGNRVKKCENLKKKLKCANICCFSKIYFKISAK